MNPSVAASHNEPYAVGQLDVGDGHRLYFEESGAPTGMPVVHLHGGPGSGASVAQRRLFDAARFRVILFDQRGAGRSTPLGETRANTTADLVADIERLRRHLGIRRWLVAGGSWGASLALAYAAAEREAVAGLLLRGMFLTGARDLAWFFQGARQFVPEAWQAFADLAPPARRRRLLDFYAEAVAGDGPLAAAAAGRWAAYEEALTQPGVVTPMPADAARLLLKYRLQAHYLRQHCFLGERRLLACARRLAGLPALLLHGRRDLVCRPENAWRVHGALGGSRLVWVDGAGHSPFDPPMTRSWLAAAGHFAAAGDFAGWQPPV